MDQNKLDQFFRNKLSAAESTKPTADDWTAAKAMLGLPQKKDDHTLLWWLLLLGLANLVFTYTIQVNQTLIVVPTIDLERAEPRASLQDESLKGHANFGDGTEKSGHSKNEIDKTSDFEEKDAIAAKPTTSDLSERSSLSVDFEENKNYDASSSRFFEKEVEKDNVIGDFDGTSKRDVVGSDPQDVKGDLSDINDVDQASELLKDIEVLSFSLEHSYRLDRPQPNSLGSLFARPKFHQTKYGWTGTLLMNPGTTVGDPVQGLQLGFAAEYYLSKHWLVGLRPSVQVTLNETGFSKFQVQTTYSFSAINETYGLRASSLQFVRLPLYMGYTIQKHTLELGAGVDWLLAARGEVQQVELEDNDISLVNALAKGWLDTDQMKQFSSDVFLGYKFAINQQLKTGVSLFYNPSNVYPGFGGQQFQSYRKWSMGFQINYYVK